MKTDSSSDDFTLCSGRYFRRVFIQGCDSAVARCLVDLSDLHWNSWLYPIFHLSQITIYTFYLSSELRARVSLYCIRNLLRHAGPRRLRYDRTMEESRYIHRAELIFNSPSTVPWRQRRCCLSTGGVKEKGNDLRSADGPTNKTEVVSQLHTIFLLDPAGHIFCT